ncbi:MAG: hypothetical protein ACT4O2_01470 [Beijerinckiaceae bacterium]
MHTQKISLLAGSAFLALTSAAFAGPTSVAGATLVAPQQAQIEQVHYRYRHRHYGRYYHRHRHYGRYHHRYYGGYGWNPAAAVAGTALGLATLPFALAGGGYYYPYYGYPYYYQ